MNPADLSHQETVTDLPLPTAGGGLAGIGVWALPAITLSVASMAVLVLVWGLLLRNELLQSLFRLPVHPSLVALSAAVVAWSVAWSCRNRPGRHLPRYWALGLAICASVVLTVTLLPPWTRAPWLDALTVALLAAALTLAPRWLQVRPESRLVQTIGPLSLLGALLLVLGPATWVGSRVLHRRETEVAMRIREIRERTQEIRELTGYDWSTLTARPQEAAGDVARLHELSFKDLLDDAEVWGAATVLGDEAELASAGEELIGAVADGLGAERAPRLSAVAEPAVRWDRERKQWLANPDFPAISTVVGGYYRELGRLLDELDPAGSEIESTEFSRLSVRHGREAERVRRHGEELLASWPEGWVVSRFPHPERWLPLGELPLVELLDISLVEGRDEVIRASDLWWLMNLPAAEARRLAQWAPGCHVRGYQEDGAEYQRLDCYAYGPHPDQPGAELRSELRLVYRSRSGVAADGRSLPVEVYFLFPIPTGQRPEAYRDFAISQLAEALRRHWDGVFRTDRGGSMLQGFVLRRDGGELRVYPPRVMPFLEGRQAVEIRGVWTEPPAGGYR